MLPLEFRAGCLSKLFLCIFALVIIVCHAQNISDFISIDCGLPEDAPDYNDDKTGIPYTSDANFIDSGNISNIQREYISDSLDRQLWTVRSFPQGPRDCYDLSSAHGKGKKYLIRATFLYGNYDLRNQTPKFDLHLGVELWDTVEFNNSTSRVTKEIIHVPSSNYTYVCLVNTGSGTPFISALELRPLNPNAYPTNTGESLAYYVRLNFAPADTNKVIRYPDDTFDRLWRPYPTQPYWSELRTSLSINVDNNYQPPGVVMQTAVTPRNASDALKFYWAPSDPTRQFYVYLHFAEVVKLQSNESRAFDVNLEDQRWYDEIIVPSYLVLLTIYATGGGTYASFDYSLVRTDNSTLPPLINALEVYSVQRFLQSQTDETDVWSILNIKSTYGVNNRNWQGDPCFPPAYKWQGLDCTSNANNKSDPPRIKSLNLSSSGLSGNVTSYLSSLTFLETLDLSKNSLNGPVPDFLADLPRLKVLDLSGNQFSGSIPQKLLDKAKNGLELRADGYLVGTSNPCQSAQCNGKKSKKFVVPLVVSLSVSAFLSIFAALIVLWRLKRRKDQGGKLGGISKRKDGFLETRNLQFTYSDLLKITNNFQRVLGKGGFGTVYHGIANGKQVAVKLLSQSSAQGYNEFQAEAELLTRVHHRNLTSLVGYCYEDTHMALVYEYMANGNLKELLSVTDNNVLSWSERLQIALDAAQGLDYLHNGCKPPIIHRDIKSTNILLNEIFEAKLADFGLSRVFTIDDGSFVSTRVVGTPGYVDPEYYATQRLHEKSDVYSLGIVILELITGRPVIMGTEEKRHIMQWVSFLLATGDVGSIVDPKLKGLYDTNSVWKALEVAMACASPTSYRRPNMAHVLTELTECLLAEKARSEGQDTDSKDLLEVNPGALEIELGPR